MTFMKISRSIRISYQTKIFQSKFQTTIIFSSIFNGVSERICMSEIKRTHS